MVYRAYTTQATQAKPGPANLLSHTVTVGFEFFSYNNAADHVSENALQAIFMHVLQILYSNLFLNDQ